MKSYFAWIFLMIVSVFAKLPCQIADHIVISEIYAGGGNSGAAYRNDFVELFNPSSSGVDLSGWSVQYASAAGSTWNVNLVGETASIGPHTFFLLKLASGGANGDTLPLPDVVGTSNLSATAGKIALVCSAIPLNGTNPADTAIIDMIGYGSSASGYEGSGPAPGGSSTISIERKALSGSSPESMITGGSDESSGNGWDSNDNAGDILQRSGPQPQNSASPAEFPPESTRHSYFVRPNWNMISVPLIVHDYRKEVLYPSAISEAILFDGLYKAKDTLVNGTGYWLKFEQKETISVAGAEYFSDSLNVFLGWNMIGAPSRPVTRDMIQENPSGIIESQIFGYDGAYISSDTLLPGRGYWIKANSGGKIVLNAGKKTGQTASVREIGETLFNTLVVTDARGMSRKLFFTGTSCAERILSSYDLPPLPPEGCFDVRFGNGRFLYIFGETFPGEDRKAAILISGAVDPVTVEWNIKEGMPGSYTLKYSKNNFKELTAIGSCQVNNVTEIGLFHNNSVKNVYEFSLSQNFPNPFNPATEVSFAIGKFSFVTLEILNILGQQVATLVREIKQPGEYRVSWDAGEMPGGVYFYRLTALQVGERSPKPVVEIRKMVLKK